MAMYLTVHSIRCSNTVGAAGQGFVAVIALDRLDGRVGGDDPLQGDWGHRSGSQAGGNGHGDDNITDAGDYDGSYNDDIEYNDIGIANLEATGVTGSGNLKCWPTPLLELLLDTPGRAVQGGVFDVTITCMIS